MNKKKVIAQTLFLAFLIVGSILIIKRHQGEAQSSRNLQPGTKTMEAGYLNNEGSIFGTIYHITYESKKDLKLEIEKAMQDVDNSLSMFNKESVVTHINNNTSQQVDSLFQKVFLISKQVYKATNGCFDPTVAPLVNAWGFGFKNGALPTDTQVDSLKALVGFDRITLEKGRIVKQDSLMIMDYSAVAKGFAVDQVAELLQQKGVKNYMVEIGGEVIVKGVNPKGKSWRVGIAKPVESEGQNTDGFETILELDNKAMATSGNYRNYYVSEDGRKLAHTIDPHSGYPIQHSILSSTVFAPTCAMADAFATSFMVMGIDEAKEVLKQEKQLEVFFIYTDENGDYQTFTTLKGLE